MDCEVMTIPLKNTCRLSYSFKKIIYNGDRFREIYLNFKKNPVEEGVADTLSLRWDTLDNGDDTAEYRVSKYSILGRETPKPAEKRRLDEAVAKYLQSILNI